MAKKSPLKLCSSLQEAIEHTIKNPSTPKTIEEIADDCNVCPSMVYRWFKDPDNSSYAKLTVDNLRRLLDSTKTYSILDYLERRAGRMAINIPKGIMPKLEEGELIDEYRELTLEVVQLLVKFFKQPSKGNKDAVDAALDEILKMTASLQKYCDKKAAGQYELNY